MNFILFVFSIECADMWMCMSVTRQFRLFRATNFSTKKFVHSLHALTQASSFSHFIDASINEPKWISCSTGFLVRRHHRLIFDAKCKPQWNDRCLPFAGRFLLNFFSFRFSLGVASLALSHRNCTTAAAVGMFSLKNSFSLCARVIDTFASHQLWDECVRIVLPWFAICIVVVAVCAFLIRTFSLRWYFRFILGAIKIFTLRMLSFHTRRSIQQTTRFYRLWIFKFNRILR